MSPMAFVAVAIADYQAGADGDEKYVCTLDAETEKKAMRELNEDPKDRLNAVKALRSWIQQQPHLSFMTNTRLLLAFLRASKFSQLTARQLVENYSRSCTANPEWMRDFDTHDPALLQVIDSGYILPLPKKDKNGSVVLLYRMGVTKPDGQVFTVNEEVRAGMFIGWFAGLEESVQVNGFALIFDMTGVSAKYVTRWKVDDIKRWVACWQKATPGRFKSFNYYSGGSVFNVLLSLIKPFLTKKMQDRIGLHGTLESLYSTVGMECLPTEYLPDDYSGPSSGSLASISENFKREIMTPEFREMRLAQTSKAACSIDESKRQNRDTAAVGASFRKVAVD